MSLEIPELYFERHVEWYDWLLLNHEKHKAVHLIFYKLETEIPTMRWEEAPSEQLLASDWEYITR